MLGSSGGESAAGRRRARPAVRRNYHVSPATVLEAVDGLPGGVPTVRDAGRAVRHRLGRRRRRPRRRAARELAAATACGCAASVPPRGAIQFPTPDEAAATVDRRGPGAGRRTASTPSSPARRRTVADQLRPCAGHRGRRAAGHHDHPRPRRPGPFVELLAEAWRASEQEEGGTGDATVRPDSHAAHGARRGARAGRAVREERLAPGGRGLAGRPGQGRSWRRAYRGRPATRPAPSPARGTTPAPRTGRIGPASGLLLGFSPCEIS